MNPSIIYANSVISAKEKIKFDETVARRMLASHSLEDASKILLPFGYDIEHEDLTATKKLTEIMSMFVEICPDENFKKFVLAAEGRNKNLANLRAKLKGMTPPSLQYIEDYFGKGVNGLPPLEPATSFDLDMFANWFIMKLEEVRIVKAILMGKKLGMTREQLYTILRGTK